MMSGNGFGEAELVSLIALLGWLVLVISGYRSYRAGPRTTLTYVLIWAALFGAAALILGALA